VRGFVDGRGKYITVPRNGLDDPLVAVAQRRPYVANASRQRFVGHDDFGPYRRHDLFFAQWPAGIFDQIAQDVEGFGTELGVVAAVSEAAAHHIEGKLFEAEDLAGDFIHWRLPRSVPPAAAFMNFHTFSAVLHASSATKSDSAPYIRARNRVVRGS
jgi:hypothetical protein